LRAVSRVVTCSIVIANRCPDADLTKLAGRGEVPEARGLISIGEESWPHTAGASAMRAILSIEADNPDSVRWYAREVLRLDEDHPAWLDMERQLGASDGDARNGHPQ
jgi:hypothetical protein